MPNYNDVSESPSLGGDGGSDEVLFFEQVLDDLTAIA